ncbi:N-6 DNA methylase [Salmonirosea aquatica]|uniref:site-specific DNA-methyltransferase (adenine-specific) n=1 Tax=Salmonirosea aquatica TaxID=2654236 RepID=A0A7C9G026_9BACT|nr:N-6 DNA methylase [Cytophagaceae bacterium SJW1-29]
MGYMMDAPPSVGPMIKILRDMGQYRYDPADVFRDFIDYAVACLLVHGDKEVAERLKRKYGAEYSQLNGLLVAWIGILDREVADDGRSWFDALGTVYEYLASTHKKGWLGQFFTPSELCDLCTRIASDPENKPVGKRINDPAVGSGRMLLSYLAHNPGNYLYGEDIDPICAKMCALNLAFHGGQGQVSCMDSLALDDFRFGFQVNPYHAAGRYAAAGPPIPHLLPIGKEQSVTWQRGRQLMEEFKAGKVPAPAPKPTPPKPAKPQPMVSQLSLF